MPFNLVSGSPRSVRSSRSASRLILYLAEGEKSTTQKVSDSTRSTADSAQSEGGSMAQNVKDTAANLAQSASDQAKQAG